MRFCTGLSDDAQVDVPKGYKSDIGGSGGRRRRAPSQQDQFLSFSHMFSLKSVCVGGWCPPPPQREFLDPPLDSVLMNCCYI